MSKFPIALTGCIGAIVLVLTGCAGDRPVDAKATALATAGLETVSVQLNWYPEVEHGGVYQAMVDGGYRDAEIEMTIRPGGRETPVAPELLLGRSQFAITNADDVVLFRKEGADIVAVLAAVQDHPRCLLVRADSGVEGFDDLAGMTLQCQPGRAFLPFLRQRGYLEGVREVPYFNSIAAMVNDPKTMVQAYSVAEPLIARQQGLEVRTLMVSELGWNPYSSVLVTTGELIRKSPELVRKVVRATQEGWVDYLDSPDRANEVILKANGHSMTPEALKFGSEELRPLVYGGIRAIDQVTDAQRNSLGQMTQERWQRLLDQMSELKLIEDGSITPKDCFTNEFLP
ncbi:ABC transporter substrate-binding protein [Neorhodopirellula pilleata]|uniref:NMT1/THI5 like protein n=1 Tax=Neorhodopirellula pilleata TaxID=2714738 RepID=A0A5C6AXT0_9BACT|nr:ABC transporter substrate-binding protein [Neorhodopirellula pilleata]TWU03886.1 NMT1/THI5 like protein [Neorhodopirellula pilleata]